MRRASASRSARALWLGGMNLRLAGDDAVRDALLNEPEHVGRSHRGQSVVRRAIEALRKVADRVHDVGVDESGTQDRHADPPLSDPSYVGELVREGIENDWPYIFTEVEFEPLIDARFAAIKQGFDRIRGREKTRAIESALADLDRRLAVLEAQRGDTHH